MDPGLPHLPLRVSVATDRVTLVQERLDALLRDHPDPASVLSADQPLSHATTLSAGRALEIFEKAGLREIVDSALTGARDRGREIAREFGQE